MIFQIVIAIICLIRCAITSEFSTSMYERDSWNKTKNKWPAELYINGKNPKSSFDNEFNVEKKLTTLCDKIESLPQNTANHDIANQQKKRQAITIQRSFLAQTKSKMVCLCALERQKDQVWWNFQR